MFCHVDKLDSFGERVSYLLDKSGLSPLDVAQKIGSSPGAVKTWQVDTEPKFFAALKLSRFFKVSPWWLAFGEDEPPESLPTIDANERVWQTIEELRAASRSTVEGAKIVERSVAQVSGRVDSLETRLELVLQQFEAKLRLVQNTTTPIVGNQRLNDEGRAS